MARQARDVKPAGRRSGWAGWVLAGLTGLLVGGGSAVAMSGGALGDGAGALRNGQWQTDLTVGAAVASPWVRARVARVGLLALPRTETVYFDSATDSAGAPLDPACTYRISGGPLAARWWSVTLYGSDQMLARNTDGAHSLDSERLGPGNWTATLSPTPPSDGSPWLSSRGITGSILMVRLYNPDPSDDAALERLALPEVDSVACPGDPAR
jgi:hypothetical protein